MEKKKGDKEPTYQCLRDSVLSTMAAGAAEARATTPERMTVFLMMKANARGTELEGRLR